MTAPMLWSNDFFEVSLHPITGRTQRECLASLAKSSTSLWMFEMRAAIVCAQLYRNDKISDP
jgi:hypothetical protein